MRRTGTIRRKAWAVVTAAALVLSTMPATALASQTNTTVNLASSTAQGVSEGEDPTGESSAMLPYASARAVQMSVTAPLRVTFEGAGNAAYDVDQKSSWGTLSAPVQFTNLCSKAVYLSDVTVQQTTDANVGNVFSGTVGSSSNPFLTLQNAAANGTETATLATLASTTATSHMQFGSSAAAADQEKVSRTFKIAKNTSGSGVSSTFTLKLNSAAATLKSNADLAASNSLKGATTDFAKIVWTFAVQAIYEEGQGTASTASDGFYLKICDNPVSDALKEYAGQVYTLAQVRRHSKLLGSGTEGAGSLLYEFYHALVTSMTPEGDYLCYVKYNGADWPVRIIGLNQDVAASSFGSGDYQYTAGQVVGLTFQFRDVIIETKLSSATTNSGGWGGTAYSTIRAALNTNGTYYNNLTIKDSIVPVRKYYSASYTTSGSVTYMADKMFLSSFYELTGQYSVFSSYPWVPNEGTGINHNEQYLFYQNKEIQQAAANYKWLVKNTTRDWATSKVTSATDGNVSTSSTKWWLRTVFPGESTYCIRVGTSGAPYDLNTPNTTYGIVPSFAL